MCSSGIMCAMPHLASRPNIHVMPFLASQDKKWCQAIAFIAECNKIIFERLQAIVTVATICSLSSQVVRPEVALQTAQNLS